MIEHAIVAGLSFALLALLNSRVQWHFHYKVRTVTVRRKEGVEDRLSEPRAVSSRPLTPVSDSQEGQITSALVNLGANKKDALHAAQAAMAGCSSRDFDSLFRLALRFTA